MSSERLFYALLLISLFISGGLAQGTASAPAASPPMTGDATAVDQGVACVLMLAALLLTYLIH